jgi:phosphomannomutase
VRFGTDGWRARVGEGFTPEVAAGAGLALAGALTGRPGRIALGYDGRALAAEAAGAVGERLKAAGWKVMTAPGPLGTPMLSRAVVRHRLDGGLMITASHNPPEFNGIKLKTRAGGSAPETLMSKAEELLGALPGPATGGGLTIHDFRGEYLAELAPWARDLLGGCGPAVVVADYMHGAAGGVLGEALAGSALTCVEIRVDSRSDFGGGLPEPIPSNLGALRAALGRTPGASLGLALDGDGDRIGVLLADGSWFNSHQVLAVLIHYLAGRGATGRVLKTFSVARLVERTARLHGLPVTETRIGFRYFVDQILEGGVLIVGEESGGFYVADGQGPAVPERDGARTALHLLAVAGTHPEGLPGVYGELTGRLGVSHYYDRQDLPLEGAAKVMPAIEAAIAAGELRELDGHPVTSVETLDGLKVNLGPDRWVMLRGSGTEPVLRIYAEGASAAEVQELLAAGAALAAGVTV